MSLSLQAIFVILMASLRHKNSRPGIARPGPIIAELSVQVLVRNAFKMIVLFLFSPFPPTTALWDLTPLFQLYGGLKTNFLIWTVPLEIISVPPCIWLVRTASSLRLAETNSADPFFFSAVLAPIWWQEWISGWLNYQFEYHCISVW